MASDGGMRKMEQLLGKEFVALAEKNVAEFDPGLFDIIVDTCFGNVWSREGLSDRLRSIVTISALAAMGKSAELRGHILIGMRNGLTLEEIKEIIIHISQYAGIPASMEAVSIFNEVTKCKD